MDSPLALAVPLAAVAILLPTAASLPSLKEPPSAAYLSTELSSNEGVAGSLLDPTAASANREVDYGLADGLPDLYVLALETGPDGRLWIATAAGLTIFDGVEFSPPHHRADAHGGSMVEGSEGTQGLANEYVYALHHDRRGRVWAATEQGSVRCYEADRVRDLGTTDRLNWSPYLAETHDGAIWAGGQGLIRITDDRITQVVKFGVEPSPIILGLAVPPQTVRDENESNETGTAEPTASDPSLIWLASHQGVYRWSTSSGLEQLDKEPCRGIFFDGRGRRWVLRLKTVEMEGQEAPCPGDDLSQRLLSTVSMGPDRTLAVLDGETLLCEVIDGRPVARRFGEAYAYRAAEAGTDGALWLALASGGLRLVCPKGFAKIPVPFAGQMLYAVRPTSDGRVAFAAAVSTDVWTARPTRENPEGTPIDALTAQPSAGSAPLHGIFDMHLNAEDRGWLATRAGIVGLSEGTTRQLSTNSALSRAKGQAIQMSTGSLWATDGDQLAEFTDQPTGRSIPLVHPILSCLIQDGEDILAFHAEKVVRYSPAQLSSTVEVELPGTLFGSVHVARNGDLWIGTDGNGIYRRRANGTLDQWSDADGLPTRYMGWIGTVPGPTEETHVWAASSAGVLSIPVASLDAVAESRAKLLTFGFIETGPSLGGAGAALEGGLLILPTLDGPISVDTHVPIETTEPPAVSVSDVRVDDEPIRSRTDFVG
ncbi:MAG: two-component regulator propeller domain-containing protein, partial [Planctomycetota bacterium]